MKVKEKLKELKSIYALIDLFEEQKDKDIKLMNAFNYPEVLKGIEKDTAKQLIYLAKEGDKMLDMIAKLSDNTANAMAMASDWLGGNMADHIENGWDIPKPSDIKTLSLVINDPFRDDKDFQLTYEPHKSFISIVMDVAKYLDSQEPIKKTLTIPRWADTLGRELGFESVTLN